jgi:ribosome maturation factor RimP
LGGLSCPFFLRDRLRRATGASEGALAGAAGATNDTANLPLNEQIDKVTMNWLQAIERTVTGLGYDLVDVERAARGLLRVTIDRVPGHAYPARDAAEPGALDTGEFVTVEDCERVTRQLQYALEVDGVEYARLEVSSPGLDRPLKRESDFHRFAGQAAEITLKLPFQGRKHWKGLLQPHEDGWRLVFDSGKGEQALDFKFDEVREARLVPVVDFKGRGKGSKDVDAKASPAKTAGVNGGQDR